MPLLGLVPFAIGKLNLFGGLGCLFPGAAVVGLVEINKEEGMVEVHEAVAFVKLASGVNGQVQRVERAFVRLVDFTD